MKLKLSPHWRRVWRRISFQAMGWAVAGIGGWQAVVPQDFKDYIGAGLAVWVLGALLAIGMAGSVIDQPNTREPETKT